MTGHERETGIDAKRTLKVLVIVSLVGGGGLSGLVWAAAKGALGKVGEVGVGWLLEHSANPADLELQRELARARQTAEEELARRQQAEKEKEADFRRAQEAATAAHYRELEDRRQ